MCGWMLNSKAANAIVTNTLNTSLPSHPFFRLFLFKTKEMYWIATFANGINANGKIFPDSFIVFPPVIWGRV